MCDLFSFFFQFWYKLVHIFGHLIVYSPSGKKCSRNRIWLAFLRHTKFSWLFVDIGLICQKKRISDFRGGAIGGWSLKPPIFKTARAPKIFLQVGSGHSPDSESMFTSGGQWHNGALVPQKCDFQPNLA